MFLGGGGGSNFGFWADLNAYFGGCYWLEVGDPSTVWFSSWFPFKPLWLTSSAVVVPQNIVCIVRSLEFASCPMHQAIVENEWFRKPRWLASPSQCVVGEFTDHGTPKEVQSQRFPIGFRSLARNQNLGMCQNGGCLEKSWFSFWLPFFSHPQKGARPSKAHPSFGTHAGQLGRQGVAALAPGCGSRRAAPASTVESAGRWNWHMARCSSFGVK